MDERYIRNFNTLSKKDQQALGRSRVAIIGLGGLGGGVCEMLARTGVGHLVLVDGDRFDKSNLNRQLLSQEHLVDTPKVDAAGARVAAVNSTVTCKCHEVFMDESNIRELISGVDIVMDCLDTIKSRFILQKAACELSIPLVSGAIAGVAGQVTVIFPGDPGFERIYSEKSRDTSRGIETETGNLSFCAVLISAIQVSEAVKVLTKKPGVLQNKLLLVDLASNRFETIDLV